MMTDGLRKLEPGSRRSAGGETGGTGGTGENALTGGLVPTHTDMWQQSAVYLPVYTSVLYLYVLVSTGVTV